MVNFDPLTAEIGLALAHILVGIILRYSLFVYAYFCCVRFSSFTTTKRLVRKNVSEMTYSVLINHPWWDTVMKFLIMQLLLGAAMIIQTEAG